MNYLDEVAQKIKALVPPADVPEGDVDSLFRIYAVLVLAKGDLVSLDDVHNAWAAWMTSRDAEHVSLVPLDRLSAEVAGQDQPYLDAMKRVARDRGEVLLTELDRVLFQNGWPRVENEETLLELYKLIVNTSESLVSRRQGVNTFFITINGAIVTVAGLVLSNVKNQRWSLGSLVAIALSGAIMSMAWRSLILSFGQLNSGKFKVINRIEQFLPASIFRAEWKALGEGKDPKIYRTFTSRETWVPWLFFAIYVCAGAAVLIFGALCPGYRWCGK